MENYFKGCIKTDHLRKRFRDLAMAHHPDKGGDTRTMQIIIEQYHQLLKSRQGEKLFNNKTKEEYAYTYDFTKEQELVDKLNEVLALKLQNVDIELIGSWLWVSGTSKEQAKLFNKDGLGMKFTKNHGGKWYWHRNVNRGFRRSSSGLSFDQIKQAHGAAEVEQRDTRIQL